MLKIMSSSKKSEEKILRASPTAVDFEAIEKRELRELVQNMKRTMRAADGIGLAANQVGVDMRMFVAEVDKKFYAIFNPEIAKQSKEMTPLEEGCLSVSGVYGDMRRAEKITLKGFDKSGKRIKIKAWGLLARVFQHEVDHLNGKLFIDRAENIHKYVPADE